MDNAIIKKVHISRISAGDTIEHNGELRTVGKSDIKTGIFFGTTIFGDSYKKGTDPVKKVTFVVPTNNGVRHQ